jgi:tetratricopeptide (TPR) repeat protein
MDELTKFALDPENALNNFSLGKYYETQGHYAPALTYYLRCAERSNDDELTYESLIRCYFTYDKQGRRDTSAKIFLEHAICFSPKRPEAHFLLARFYERRKEYVAAYRESTIALEICDFSLLTLSDVEYPGKYGLLFEKGISAYWWGKGKECRLIFRDLIDNYEMEDHHKTIIVNNLTHIGAGPAEVAMVFYDKSKSNKLRHKFNNYDKIERNFSQCYQDMFVLSILDGKSNGTYLEIGGGDPYWGNNTALLENNYNWNGVSIEYNKELVNRYSSQRKNKILCKNALEINYEKFLEQNFNTNVIDYLQLDCEPSKSTFEILLSIPFDKYKFAVITYEHDHFVDVTKTYRTKSRNYLKMMGYELVVNDIGPTDWYSFEDWWVHPDLVNVDILQKMRQVTDSVNQCENYMLIR